MGPPPVPPAAPAQATCDRAGMRWPRPPSAWTSISCRCISTAARRSRDYSHRRQATQRIGQITIGNTPILELDRDVLVLGDYNTMGREDAPPVSAQEELAMFDGELSPGFRRLPMTPNCTEYFEGKGGALDHIVASTSMQEAAATARVTGYCALAGCAPITGAMPAAAERLSDHCPVVVDIQDRDLD